MHYYHHLLAFTLCGIAAAPGSAQAVTPYIPHYDHVVVVIMENRSAADIYDNSSAPYLNGTLIANGAKFTNSFGIAHPSQPNYIALFSGSTQGVIDDSCPKSFSVSSLAQQLSDTGLSFTQYSEDLPSVGNTICSSGLYARKHNPIPDFPALPVTMNQPYSSFAGALASATLPTVSFVAPNLCNDMHGDVSACSATTTELVKLGDDWLKTNMPQYFISSSGNNGLLIVTWDEDDNSSNNLVPTVFYGPHVKAGYTTNTQINHYNILRTLEDMYGLAALGGAATATPITDVWDDTIFKNTFE